MKPIKISNVLIARIRNIFLIAGAVFALSSGMASAQEKPPALRALESQGVTIVGPLRTPGGLNAWAGYSGQHPVALYGTPDGKHVIAGTMFDVDGNDVNHDMLEKAVAKSMTGGTWSQLEQSRWIMDGSSKAPRTIYVFTDPNCPYCNTFWSRARPWVNSGKVQLRHIMIGILTPTSRGKAAALFSDKDPGALLKSHELSQVAASAKIIASHDPRALGESPLKPLANIPPALEAQLASNEKLMFSLGLQGTPGIVWKDSEGKIRMLAGLPSSLADVLGPK